MLFSLLQNKIFLSAVALLIGTAFVICVMLKKNAKVYNGILILAICIVTLWANGSGRFSPFKGDYISEYITYGTAEPESYGYSRQLFCRTMRLIFTVLMKMMEDTIRQ